MKDYFEESYDRVFPSRGRLCRRPDDRGWDDLHGNLAQVLARRTALGNNRRGP